MSDIRSLKIAVLVKQVPKFDTFALGPDGRLARTGALELNPYCRRAVAQGVALARDSGGTSTVVTLGPPAAEDCLREAVACGADKGVLVSDRAFAGSDTLATARALAAALRRLGPFDVVLCGRNSVDADTGQTPAQIAELLGLPMAAGVRQLAIGETTIAARCEHDDGWLELDLPIPALLTCAERLIAPAKATAEERAAVLASRISRLDAGALGAGPWGQAGSMTAVGATRVLDGTRLRRRFEGDLDAQIEEVVSALVQLGALDPEPERPAFEVPAPRHSSVGGRGVAVLAEPHRARQTRALLGAAANLAGGTVTALTVGELSGLSPALAGSWGADVLVGITGSDTEEDIAAALASWCARHEPWAVLAPSTMWGREITGRVAARLGAGLVGDAVDVAADPLGGLVCWKPAFSGGLVAAVTCLSRTGLVTVRGGTLPLPRPRRAVAGRGPDLTAARRGRVRVRAREQDDDLDALALARAVVCVGAGVSPEDYPLLDPLLTVLGADLAATRKVTDRGWQPRARQVGVTGRSVAPRLFVAVGTSGRFNHLVGARGAGTILGITDDPSAPLFENADLGIVTDWRDAVPRLAAALARLGRDAPQLVEPGVREPA
ncbi:MAG TPA: FAD-binding protein [Amycolatopsis sp.]|uniref:FAD-binding protein n=1 Tax=Amycolatopsis sp. TaxID=37632 RepID=UPI002B485BC8|nr:FAD-binding protein [Amycolatopsis sp.]HKS47438.1 FAD-binding protein [Amycolatopsis sp.]